MTAKLCVMGNSHVAALKDGWPPKGDEGLHIHADFFGCLKDGMASFGKRQDGLFGPLEEGAAQFFKSISTTGDFVDLDRYDAFVLSGMKFFPGELVRHYADFATPRSGNHATARQMVTEDVLEAALWDDLNAGMMMHVVRVLKAATDAPVFVVWQPFLSEALLQIEWRAALYGPLLANHDSSYVTDIMARIDARLAAMGVQVLRQPADTITQGVMTARCWSDGSRQFRAGGGSEHRALDVFHMNAAFGAACWSHWLTADALGAALPGAGKQKGAA